VPAGIGQACVKTRKLPILRKEISSGRQQEAIHRGRGPSPGQLAAGKAFIEQFDLCQMGFDGGGLDLGASASDLL
jgi:hypothetical protein